MSIVHSDIKANEYPSLALGYAIAYGLHYWDIGRQIKKLKRHNGETPRGPEEKLRLLMFLAPLELFGLGLFAICSLGPDRGVPWIAPMLASVLVGIANYSIYMATIDYMVEAYGAYAASATGGNGFARDLLAGLSALWARPLYSTIQPRPLVFGSVVLTACCLLVVAPVFAFFFCGPSIRARSHFSKKVQRQREEAEAREMAPVRASLRGSNSTLQPIQELPEPKEPSVTVRSGTSGSSSSRTSPRGSEAAASGREEEQV